MTFHAILASHGFAEPYSADHARPGSVVDARARAIPFLIVPGVLGCQDRREFSRILAAQLNAEAAAETARKVA